MKNMIWLGVTCLLLCSALLIGCDDSQTGSQQPYSPQSALQRAESSLLAVLHQKPNDLETIKKLGNVYFDGGRPDKAAPMYLKVLEKEPKNSNVRTDLGTCYKRMGKLRMAANEFERVVKDDPNHINANFNLGVVREAQGQHLKAAERWEKAAKLAQALQEKAPNKESYANTIQVSLKHAQEAREKAKAVKKGAPPIGKQGK
jgi:tetratricopeptide (TPR) repeat protein